MFVALIGSLLTAVPLSPAGLGIVEAGVVGVLTVVYGVPLPEATAIALLDRVISVFSIIVFGSIAYVVSPKPRGMGRIPQPVGIDPAPARSTPGRRRAATCATPQRIRAGRAASGRRRWAYLRHGGRTGPRTDRRTVVTAPLPTAPARGARDGPTGTNG